MTLQSLITRLTSRADEYGLRFDVDALPARYQEIADCLVSWADQTRMWFCDSTSLELRTLNAVGPFRIDDGIHWFYNGSPVKLLFVSEMFSSDSQHFQMTEVGAIEAAAGGMRHAYNPATRVFYRAGINEIGLLGNTTVADALVFPASGYRYHEEFDWTDPGFDPDSVDFDIPHRFTVDFLNYCLCYMLANSPVAEQGDRYAELKMSLFGPDGKGGRIAEICAMCNDFPSFVGRPPAERIQSIGRVNW